MNPTKSAKSAKSAKSVKSVKSVKIIDTAKNKGAINEKSKTEKYTNGISVHGGHHTDFNLSHPTIQLNRRWKFTQTIHLTIEDPGP